MANYFDAGGSFHQTTPGVVLEVPVAGFAGTSTAVTAGNPLPVTFTGGGSGQTVNLVQVGGNTISLGQDPTISGPISLPVVLPAGYTLAISGTVSATLGSLVAGTAVIGALVANQSVNTAQINGVTPLMGNGVSGTGAQRVTLASDSTGQVALASGSQVQPIPGTTGGLSMSRTLVAANNTAIVIKGSAGTVYHISCFNNSTSIAYAKFYNATSATAGSGTPVWSLMIPAPSSGGGGFVMDIAMGLNFSTGITMIVLDSTSYADNATTAPAANTFIVNVGYK